MSKSEIANLLDELCATARQRLVQPARDAAAQLRREAAEPEPERPAPKGTKGKKDA